MARNCKCAIVPSWFILMCVESKLQAYHLPCFKSSGLEKLRQQIAGVHELLVDPRSTEFIIVTIPTVKATTHFLHCYHHFCYFGNSYLFLTIVIACWHLESCLLLYAWTAMNNIDYVAGYIHSLIQSKEQFCLDMRLWNKYGASCRRGVSLILLVGACFLRWWQLASHQDSTHP
jgi:hypothetical protein